MPPEPILVDDEQTWPAEMRELLEKHFETLCAYERVETEIDKRAEADVMLRIRPPPNKHQATYKRVLDKCDRILAGANLIGYHCARLHDDDIKNILSDGLRPLSLNHLNQRIDQRQTAGDLRPSIASKLKENNQAGHEYRSGLLSLIFTQFTLQIEGGIIRLFRSWGGEALYNMHEEDPETGPYLRKIGTPCIIRVSVPVSDIDTYWRNGERIISGYLSRRDVVSYIDPELEGRISVSIRPDCILQIIRRRDSEFVNLTNCETWREIPR